jgi:hypothetical protein
MNTFIPPTEFTTPVLLLIFSRPHTTRQVFESIRRVRPTRLYVAADGPREGKPGEAEKCEETRRIIHEVDWPCEVKTLFQEKNLNCGVGPATAITWFFENEEAGIILEDDCVPCQSFFWFCQELLDKYRNDTRIMQIGGNNHLAGWQKDKDYSYYFSIHGHTWGWATWRRAWQLYDFDIKNYPEVLKKGYLDDVFLSKLETKYTLRKLDQIYNSKVRVDLWDYQWEFAKVINSGLSIVPQVNLVSNVGFGKDATHTLNAKSADANMAAKDIEFPLKHPRFVIRDIESDKKYFRDFMASRIVGRMKGMFAS